MNVCDEYVRSMWGWKRKLTATCPPTHPPTHKQKQQECIYGRKHFNPGGNHMKKETLQRASATTGFLRRSNLALGVLTKICKEQGLKFRRPQPAVDTRWDTEYKMLCVIFWLRGPLQEAWANQEKYSHALPLKSKSGKTDYFLGPDHWVVLEQLVLLLGRLERVTRALEGSNYVTLPYAYPELYMLYEWLGEKDLEDPESAILDFNAHEGGGGRRWAAHDVDPSIDTLRFKLRESMRERFPFFKHLGTTISSWPEEDRTEVKLLVVAMALHPVISGDGFSGLDHPDLVDDGLRAACREALQQQARDWVVEMACDLYRDRFGEKLQRGGTQTPAGGGATSAAAAAAGGGASGSAGASQPSQPSLPAGGLVGTMARWKAKRRKVDESVEQRVREQYESFLGAQARLADDFEAELQRVGDELQAYKAVFAHRYDLLCLVYRAVAAIPASGAGAESLFSGAGLVASVRRPNLCPAQIAKQTGIRANFRTCLLDISGYKTERAKGGKGEEEKGKGKEEEGKKSGPQWEFCPVKHNAAQKKKQVFDSERGEVEQEELPSFLEGLVISAAETFEDGFGALQLDGDLSTDAWDWLNPDAEPDVVQLPPALP